VLFSVILSILHEKVFQLHKIHTKPLYEKFLAMPLTSATVKPIEFGSLHFQ